MEALQIILQPAEFDDLFAHVNTFRLRYKNMHLREAHQVQGKRCLRYLQMIRVKDASTLEGAVSGPNIEAHYELRRGAGRVSVRFLRFKGTPKETMRFQRRFVTELLNRVEVEKNYSANRHPKRLPGQFYLMRHPSGMDFNHERCQRALAEGKLHDFFLRKLAEWNFHLLCPGS